MIVISGVLVLVALILLVVGVTMQELDFVYASIVVSLISLVFLVIGIIQRRGSAPATASRPSTPAPATGFDRPAPRAEVTTVAPPPSAPRTSTLSGVPGKGKPAAAAAPAASEPAAAPVTVPDAALEGGVVLVMSGRPRYHVDGCRYLSSKNAEEMDVVEAREEGFTPCGVCKPDEALLEAIAAYDEQEWVDDGAGDEPVEDERVEEPVEAAPAGRPRKASTSRAPTAVTATLSKAAGAGAALSGAALTKTPLAKTPLAKTRFAKGAPAAAAEDPMPKTPKTPKSPSTPPTEAGPAESAGVTTPGTTARGRGTGKATPTVAAPGEASGSRSVSRRSAPSAQPAPPAPPKRAAGVPAKPGAKKLVTKQGASKVTSSGGADGDTSGGSMSGEAALNSPSSTDVSPGASRGGPELAETSGPSPVAMKPGAPARKAAAAGAGEGAATRPRRAGSVVVVPGRPRFHKPGCRFVRDAGDAESLTPNQAAKKGYTACGACKPG